MIQTRRMTSYQHYLGGLLVCIALLVAACGGGDGSTTTGSSTPGAAYTTASTTSTPAIAVNTPASTPATATPAAANKTAGVLTFQVVPDSSTASYAATERIFRLPTKTPAIGKAAVTGGTIEFSLTDASKDRVRQMTVDLRNLQSDKSQRDNFLHQHALESDQFPTAEFNSTSVQGMPAKVTEGQEVSFKLLGTLKVHNVEKPVTFDVKATVQGGRAVARKIRGR